MKHWKLTRWCTYAVQKIRYGPDREKVYKELRQHLDDRCEDFLAQGMDEETAADKVWEVMGDPREIAEYLGKIHTPWLGWAYCFVKLIARCALLLLVLLILHGLFTDPPTIGNYQQHDFSNYEQNPYDHPDWKVYSSAESFSDSGYTVKLDKYTVNTAAVPALFFQLKITNFLPWAQSPVFPYWMEATDSLGRTYIFSNARSENEYTRDHYVWGILYHSAPRTWTYHGRIHIENAEAITWVDLHYRLDGRDYTLRIDLEGGGL